MHAAMTQFQSISVTDYHNQRLYSCLIVRVAALLGLYLYSAQTHQRGFKVACLPCHRIEFQESF